MVKSIPDYNIKAKLSTATNPIGDYLAIKTKYYWQCPPVENNWQDVVDAVDAVIAVDCGSLR